MRRQSSTTGSWAQLGRPPPPPSFAKTVPLSEQSTCPSIPHQNRTAGHTQGRGDVAHVCRGGEGRHGGGAALSASLGHNARVLLQILSRARSAPGLLRTFVLNKGRTTDSSL